MTDKLHCPLYHDFDGHCCAEGQECLYQQPVRVIPLEPKRAADELVTQMPLHLLLALTIVCGLIGFGSAVWLDHHYKKRDRIDQEITWRLKP